jgi:hypothetical protein
MIECFRYAKYINRKYTRQNNGREGKVLDSPPWRDFTKNIMSVTDFKRNARSHAAKFRQAQYQRSAHD